jgi:hypothetical protein
MFVKCLYIYNVALIEVEILFVFFQKTKRLKRKAGKWIGKCPSLLLLKKKCSFVCFENLKTFVKH